jgi:hypothetical protein
MKKSTIKQIKSSIRKKQIRDVPDKKKQQNKKLCRLRIDIEK